MDELNFDTNNLGHFKRILLDYYYKSLAVNYDSENPRTFKSICMLKMQLSAQSYEVSNIVLLLDIVICFLVCLYVNVMCLLLFVIFL